MKLEPYLLEISTDEVLRLNKLGKEVRRDAPKMKAFVRFRKIERDGEECFIAWHRPDHRIVRKVAPFFSRRFKAMNWTILTPDESVIWDQKELHYGVGVPRSEAPQSDELETLWKTYYANIFNPARVKIKMMKAEMPVRFWTTLPEAEIIADLLMQAPARVEEMIARHEGFADTVHRYLDQATSINDLSDLAKLAAICQACDLYREATQIVLESARKRLVSSSSASNPAIKKIEQAKKVLQFHSDSIERQQRIRQNHDKNRQEKYRAEMRFGVKESG